MKSTSLFFLFLWIALSVCAQPLCHIDRYSINDGLAQGIIMSYVQDSKGCMWFASWNGLNKFDGYTFETFNNRTEEGSELENNRIEFMNHGKFDQIWCRTYDEKSYLFDPDTKRFTNVLKTIPPEQAMSKRLNILSKGVVWFICEDGYCYRFDERTYKTDPRFDSYSVHHGNLNSNVIYEILQDSEEDEWILTGGGVKIIGQKEIHDTMPFQFFLEVNDTIWLATNDGRVGKYNKQTGDVTHIHLPIANVTITGLNVIDNQLLSIGTTENGLILYHLAEQTFQIVDVRTPQQPFNSIESMYVDSYNLLWIFTPSPGITQWDQERQVVHYFPPLPSIHAEDKYKNYYFIQEDANGELWINPRGGCLNFYDRKNNKILYFQNDPNNPNSLLSSSIHSRFFDKQGNLWINTANRSLKKISFYHAPLVTHSLGSEARTLYQDNKGRLWIATRDKKVRIYNRDKELIGFLNPKGEIVKQECLFHDNIYSITKIGDELWLGSRSQGLYILKETHNHPNRFSVRNFQHHPTDSLSLSDNAIFSIFQDSNKRVWIGTFGGGINWVYYTPSHELRFANSNNSLKHYPQNQFAKVRCIAETPNGILLIGTTGGLVTFSSLFTEPQRIRFHTYTHNPNDTLSLSNNNVSDICITTQKETYLSTFGGGINKIVHKGNKPEELSFQSYSRQSGLASEWIASITEDRESNLWFVSENLISKLSLKDNTFEGFRWNLLRADMFYSEGRPTIYNNSLLLGTNKGYINLSVQEMYKSQYVPSIVLTSIRVLNEEIPIPTDKHPEISLTPDQRNITIEFAALDYANPSNINYTYKLTGVDSDWNHASRKRSVSYINIPRGKYTLAIRSTNSDGVWVDNEYTLSINVLPKFTETGWFWSLMFLLLITLIVATVYILFYIYRLRHQVDTEQQITDIKLRFFTNISHELRTPLTLIAGPVSELLKEDLPIKSKEYLGLMQKNIDRMLRLVNQILDFRKIQNHKMKLLIEEVDIIQFASTIMEHFELQTKSREISLRLVAPTSPLWLWIDSDKIEKVIFNLLSNAFKYTPDGKSITLEIDAQEDVVNISIIDEGIGISADKMDSIFQRFETIINGNAFGNSSGIGLSLTRELVEMHDGTISVSSKLGVGSCFTISIPMGKDHFVNKEHTEFTLSDSQSEEVWKNKTGPIDTTIHEDTREKTTILIVEDNDSLRNFLCSILSSEYNIIEAANGEGGYNKAKELIPDFIISDVMMPVMDGLDMVKAIKEDKDICHIPIVLLSAKSSLDDRINGLEYGIDDYITKPFSTDYLKARIASLIKTRKLLQEAYRNKLLSGEVATTRPDISPTEPQIVPHDQLFIKQLMAFMEENIDNSALSVEDFAKEFALGRTSFYTKVKSLLGVSPIEFINEIRIKRAIQLINNGERNIAQIAYAVGFDDPKYFSRCFKKQTGMTPVQYREQDKGE
ncbi:hybrid sensor histidine kinase/response regulator [Bacteroides sp. 214]|uniref:hybrid sensor histidine kinase/response regulator transcription factor n=1 Tax=Bacteroides sp. 214 TaxID=2302935 RepID=UPI0013D70F5D|nr:hybrid sensor histidine kinase/response regulator transcription factor [Bacteroides sp. 214]NDW12841.1 hybrid sensor histidine kinase/response regulator [Bacteroides sp. 214]